MKQTAQGLAALGRGPDTQLVHMAPSEVAGLQALAKAHGGSLTINPATGLPEAGFLSSILPMVIGAGLMAATGGAAAPLVAGMSNAAVIGMGVGGLQTLRTGSLSKGLMAGLGAYGGAGLAGGLMGAATTVPALGPELPTAVPEAALAAPTATPAITAAGAAPATTAATPYYPSGVGAEYMNYPVAAPVPAVPVTTVTPMAPSTSSGFGGAGTDLSVAGTPAPITATEKFASGAGNVVSSPSAMLEFAKANKYPLGAMGISALGSMEPDALNAPEASKGMIRPFTYSREKIPGAFQDVAGAPMSSKERRYFTDKFTAGTPYAAPGPEYMAAGGPVEAMSNANAIGASTGFPQSNIRTGAYSVPFQQPMGQNVVTGAQDAAVDPYTGQAQFADGGSIGGYTYDQATGKYSGGIPLVAGSAPMQYANGSVGGYSYDPATGQYARLTSTPEYLAHQAAAQATPPSDFVFAQGGGISDLGGYSDGGRLLRGPGDGVSDNIPAMIGKKQPARLADGEFVVPARIVSELGNGSTEAGARQLYAMMDRVQKNRKKSIGKDKVAADSKSSRLLPA